MRLPLQRRDRLQIAIIINQLATPGLGSWIAGHRVAGVGQLAFSILGFLDFLVRCVRLIIGSFQAALDGAPPPPFPWDAWHRALVVFGIAWVWAGLTSVQIALEMRKIPRVIPSSPSRPSTPHPQPPRLG
ncbi:MAG: hypothetical protein AB7O66_21055 [Limisphaerales bacterium]